MAALLVLVMVLAVQGGALLPGKVALFADTYAVPPWAALAPPEGSGHPRLVTDSLRYTYPSWEFAHDELWAGRLPLWNPYVFCGHDRAGSIQPAVFYPARLALSFLPPGRGMTLYVVLHTLLLALATLAWLLGRGSGAAPAAAGGIVVALSGYVLAKMGQPSIVVALAWLPVMVWLVDRLIDRPSARLAAGLAGAVAMCLLSGHPQMFVLILVTSAAFGLAAILRRRLPAASLARRVPYLALATVLALAAASPQLVAYLGTYPGSREVAGEQEPPPLLRPRVESAIGLLAPEPFGSPREGTFRHVRAKESIDQPGKRRIWHTGAFLYPGALTLLLLPLALASLRRHPFAAEGLALAASSTVFVFVDPLADVVMSVPGLGFAPVDRLLALGTFGWAVLAAAGVGALTRCPSRRVLALLALGGLALVAALAAVAALDLVPDVGLASLGRTFLMAVVSLAVLVPAAIWRRARPALPVLAVMVLAVDLLPVAKAYFPAVHAAEVLPATKVTGFLKGEVGHGRIVRFETKALRANTASVFDLRDAQGFAPLYSGDYRSLMRRVVGRWPDPRSITALAGRETLDSPWLRALGVSHVISERPLRHPAWRAVLREEGLVISESIRAAPRARVVERCRWAESREEAVRLLGAPSHSPMESTVLIGREEGGLAEGSPGAGAAARARARFVRDEPRRVELEVTAPRGGWLVLADTYHPAWIASVDGEPAPLFRADLALRAVPVPPGSCRVVFSYRPGATLATWRLAWAAWLLIAALLGGLGGMHLLRRVRGRVT
jgi:hypothetical protein